MSNHKETIEQKINEALDNIDLITDPYQKAELLLKAAEVMIRVEGVTFSDCECSKPATEAKPKKTRKHADAMKRQPETLGTDEDNHEEEEKAPSVEEDAAGPIETEEVPAAPTPEPPAEEDPWAGHEEEIAFIKSMAEEYGDEAINYALNEYSSGLLTDWKEKDAINPMNITGLVEVINALIHANDE